MEDAVSRYRRASEANDIDALMATLSDDVEVVSPISGTFLFRGSADVRVLFSAVYGTLNELRWDSEVGEGSTRVVLGTCRVGPLLLGDAMVLELAGDGRIARVRPHLRPWLALTLFALVLGPKLARDPGIIWRAIRAA